MGWQSSLHFGNFKQFFLIDNVVYARQPKIIMAFQISRTRSSYHAQEHCFRFHICDQGLLRLGHFLNYQLEFELKQSLILLTNNRFAFVVPQEH